MPNPATTKPPTPRRCRRMVEAHHFDCQGLSLRQIGRQMDSAPSTVHSCLRDFRLHRNHVLRTVATDQLADQVHILTQPQTDPVQHRQAVANAQELRLLLRNLPDIQEHNQHQREQAIAPADSEVLDGPGLIETEPDQSCPDREQSGHLRTNLNTSATISQASTASSLRSR
ncbi:MAG: hypothetical protein OXD50_07550 [Chloroflexi bacterium]|nr:hypothetical protein [Chloroflexota bacterium]